MTDENHTLTWVLPTHAALKLPVRLLPTVWGSTHGLSPWLHGSPSVLPRVPLHSVPPSPRILLLARLDLVDRPPGGPSAPARWCLQHPRALSPGTPCLNTTSLLVDEAVFNHPVAELLVPSDRGNTAPL